MDRMMNRSLSGSTAARPHNFSVAAAFSATRVRTLAGVIAGAILAFPGLVALPGVASADASADADAVRESVAKFNSRGPDYDPTVGSPEDHEKLDEIRELLNAGRINETIEECIKLIESGNRQGEVLFYYGRSLALARMPGRASWALDAAMDDPDWIVPAAHQLAQDNYQASNFEIVVEVLDRLAANRPDPETDDLFAMVMRGRAHLGTRRHYEEALEVFEEVLAIQPAHEEALRLKGVALLGLGRSDEAWEIIEQGRDNASQAELALGVTDREAYWCGIQVTFNREAGDAKKSEKLLNECLEKHPTNGTLIQEASILFGNTGRFDRLIEVMRAAHKAKPDDIELRQGLVLQLRALGRREEAEQVIRDAIERTPDELTGEPRIALAGFLIDGGRLEEGLKAYEEASKRLNNTLPPEQIFAYAEALIQAERFDEANAIAEKTPIEVHRPMIRGRVAYERGDYELAQKELAEAAKIWPDNAPVRYYLARTAEALGDIPTAIEEYRQCMRSDANLSEAKERLTRLHLAEGRVRHAMTILRFQGAEAGAAPSPDSRLLEIEIQSILGVDPDLSRLVPDSTRSISEIRRLAVEAYARGIRMRAGPEEVVEALDKLEESVELENKDLLIGERVFNLVLLNRAEEAEKLARQAVKESPGSVISELALARALIASDLDSEEAHSLLRGIVKRAPENVAARVTLGELELQAGDHAIAETLFREALKIEPDHQIATEGLTNALVAMDRKQEAIDGLRDYLAREGPYDGIAALRLATLLEATPKNEDKRIALAKRAVRFGAGKPAVDLLINIDPKLVPAPLPGKQEERAEKQPEAPKSSG